KAGVPNSYQLLVCFDDLDANGQPRQIEATVSDFGPNPIINSANGAYSDRTKTRNGFYVLGPMYEPPPKGLTRDPKKPEDFFLKNQDPGLSVIPGQALATFSTTLLKLDAIGKNLISFDKTTDALIVKNGGPRLVLQRLADPNSAPNPLDPATGLPKDPTKPYNPYVVVDFV